MTMTERYTQLNNARFHGFFIDIKTKVWYKPERQSGAELFFQTIDGDYVSCYVAHDPYFYVVFDDPTEEIIVKAEKMIWRQSKDKERGQHRIKEINRKMKHVFGSYCDHFYHKIPVLQVVAYTPDSIGGRKNVSGLREDVGQIVGEDNVRESKILFHHRIMIDLGLNPGKLYDVHVNDGFVVEYKEIDTNKLPNTSDCCIFDIEIKKRPIKKPMIGDPINIIGFKHGNHATIINNLDIHGGIKMHPFFLGEKDGRISPLTEAEANQSRKYKAVYFDINNVKDEWEVIDSWKSYLMNKMPLIAGGYNSDAFDWQQIIQNGERLYSKIKFDDFFTSFDDFDKAYDKEGHVILDAFDFIERDSYLAKGNRGLKDVSKKLLGIEPLEIDHEATVRLLDNIKEKWTNPEHPEYDIERAQEAVQSLGYYCASDVFVTSVLLEEHVIPLDFSLSTIIPMRVFESARKARGPMVELLLLKRMFEYDMVAPNMLSKTGEIFINFFKEGIGRDKNVYKQIKKKKWARCVDDNWIDVNCISCNSANSCKTMLKDSIETNKHFYCKIHRIDLIGIPNVTMPIKKYKFEGAYVEVFNMGIFKDNCPVEFKIDMDYMDVIAKKMQLVLMKFKKKKEREGYTITDIDKYIDMVNIQFAKVKEKCKSVDGNNIYHGMIVIIHVDVASMYPSIITTYCLQPYGVVTDLICSACEVRNKEGERECWVDLPWNSMYETLNIPEKMERIIMKKMEGKNDRDDIIETSKKVLKIAYNKGLVKKPRGMYGKYKMNEVARFCQKAHKFFIDAVSDFKKERLKYKYKEKNDAGVISKLEKVHSLRLKIESLQKEVKKHIDGRSSTDVNSLKSFSKDIKQLSDEIAVILPGYSDLEVQDIISEIHRMEIEKVFNRNAQLSFKVILNAIYGWLKSIGARLWSIEVTGCTTLEGQHVIQWVVDYTNGFSLKIELDTDGIWNGIPVDFPLKIDVEMRDKDGRVIVEELNLFNSILNDDVCRNFINMNNYEFDKESGEYINVPKNDISFDYDGPYSTFISFAMKKYMVFARDRKDASRQVMTEMKGLDLKRKGEMQLSRDVEEVISDYYKNGESYDECYENAARFLHDRLEIINSGNAESGIIYESRDISSVNKIKEAIELFKDAENGEYYDPGRVPMNVVELEKKVDSYSKTLKKMKTRLGIKVGKENVDVRASRMESIFKIYRGLLDSLKSISTRHGIGCFRMADMGIDVEDGDTIQWIVTRFPDGGGVTQRVVPVILFNASLDDIKKYLYRWLGYLFVEVDEYPPVNDKEKNEEMLPESEEDKKMKIMREIIDWKYYKNRLISKAERVFFNLYRSQKNYISVDLVEKYNLNDVMDGYDDDDDEEETRSRVTIVGTRPDRKKSFSLEEFI